MSFYTSLEIKNGTYVGAVFNASNNQLLHKTQEYNNQQAALKDITNFINTIPSAKPTKSVAQVAPVPAPITGKKCCGR